MKQTPFDKFETRARKKFRRGQKVYTGSINAGTDILIDRLKIVKKSSENGIRELNNDGVRVFFHQDRLFTTQPSVIRALKRAMKRKPKLMYL